MLIVRKENPSVLRNYFLLIQKRPILGALTYLGKDINNISEFLLLGRALA